MNQPPPHSPGKSKKEIFLALAQLSEQSTEKRKDVEWKVNISFWMGIGVFTWFGVKFMSPLTTDWLWGFAIAYVAALAIWILGWQIPLHAAHKIDKRFKHYYAEMAEGLDTVRPTEEESEPTFMNYFWEAVFQPWFWGQVLMTAIFLALSLMAITQSSGKMQTPPNGDSLTVSGENLKTVLKKLTQ